MHNTILTLDPETAQFMKRLQEKIKLELADIAEEEGMEDPVVRKIALAYSYRHNSGPTVVDAALNLMVSFIGDQSGKIVPRGFRTPEFAEKGVRIALTALGDSDVTSQGHMGNAVLKGIAAKIGTPEEIERAIQGIRQAAAAAELEITPTLSRSPG